MFAAIKHHTVATPQMTVLDMIVFVADKIEPTHEVDVYKRLAKQVGKISLEDLFSRYKKQVYRILLLLIVRFRMKLSWPGIFTVRVKETTKENDRWKPLQKRLANVL